MTLIQKYPRLSGLHVRKRSLCGLLETCFPFWNFGFWLDRRLVLVELDTFKPGDFLIFQLGLFCQVLHLGVHQSNLLVKVFD